MGIKHSVPWLLAVCLFVLVARDSSRRHVAAQGIDAGPVLFTYYEPTGFIPNAVYTIGLVPEPGCIRGPTGQTLPGTVAVTVLSTSQTLRGVGTYVVTCSGLTTELGRHIVFQFRYYVSYRICPPLDQAGYLATGVANAIYLSLCDAANRDVSSPDINVSALRLLPRAVERPSQIPGVLTFHPPLRFTYYEGVFRGPYRLEDLSFLWDLPPGIYDLEYAVDGDPIIHVVPLQVEAVSAPRQK